MAHRRSRSTALPGGDFYRLGGKNREIAGARQPGGLWYPPGRMRDLTERALDTATQLGAEYADVRVVRSRSESIGIKSGRVEGVASGESEGFGLRVLVDGAWGFASSNELTSH